MKKHTKFIIFLASAVANIIFFLAFDYGKVQVPDTSKLLDPIFGVLAVAALAFGETKVAVQIYYRDKYRKLTKRTFDIKFWRQCFVLVLYYVGTLVFLAASHSIYEAGYMSIFAMVLSPLWLTGGSRILWTGHSGEEAYYLDEFTKWYKVSGIMENDDVLEIKCQAPGDRERTISIAKKKQKLDQ